LMLQMAKPRKPRRGEDRNGIYWYDDPERLERLYMYARRDLESERELDHRLYPLIREEQRLWAYDAVVNDRGFHLDRDLGNAMVRIVETAEEELNAELARLTGGAVTRVGQIPRLTKWLADQGCTLVDLQKATVSHALRRNSLEPEVRRVLE